MFACVLSVLITSLASIPAFAGEATPFTASIQSRQVSEDRSIIEYCELGNCRSLGPAKGYTTEEWQKVAEICDEYSYVGTSVIDSGVDLGALSVAVSKLAMQAKVLLLAGFFIFDGKVSEEDAANASDMVKGMLAKDLKFPMTLDRFISLRNGIEACSKEYEWRNSKYYKRYINGWARPLG